MPGVLPYRTQMEQIRRLHGDCSFAEFERENGITTYSYEEVGYGYRLRDEQPADTREAHDDLSATPSLDEIEALAMAAGV